MQTQYINEMLDIPELQIRQILPMSTDEVHIEVTPVAQKQCCPICKCFPNAIRIANHFHVHGYVIEAVQEVRKAAQSTLAPRAKVLLKAYHQLLNPKAKSLPAESKKRLDELLSYSPLLRSVWEWKEVFTTWYDYSSSVEVAKLGFERWCKQGEQIDHEAVRSTIKRCEIGKKKSLITITVAGLTLQWKAAIIVLKLFNAATILCVTVTITKRVF